MLHFLRLSSDLHHTNRSFHFGRNERIEKESGGSRIPSSYYYYYYFSIVESERPEFEAMADRWLEERHRQKHNRLDRKEDCSRWETDKAGRKRKSRKTVRGGGMKATTKVEMRAIGFDSGYGFSLFFLL